MNEEVWRELWITFMKVSCNQVVAKAREDDEHHSSNEQYTPKKASLELFAAILCLLLRLRHTLNLILGTLQTFILLSGQ